MKKLFLTFGLIFSGFLGACPLHITNDTSHSVLLVESDGDYAQLVTPGQKIVIGNGDKHLGFYLFKAGQSLGSWIPVCTVMQHTCTASKRVDSTISVIENGQLDTTFFSYGKGDSTNH